MSSNERSCVYLDERPLACPNRINTEEENPYLLPIKESVISQLIKDGLIPKLPVSQNNKST